MRDTQEHEFTEFVAANRVQLRRVAYALCGDWHRADDLVQTALIKLYKAWPRVRRDGREFSYVRTILVRANIDASRVPWRREQPHSDSTWFFADSPAPLSADDTHGDLISAVQALPKMQRHCLLLRHWLDLSVAETADVLRISEGTVKSHTSRAIAALHGHLSHLKKP